jgi:hypothetical protein
MSDNKKTPNAFQFLMSNRSKVRPKKRKIEESSSSNKISTADCVFHKCKTNYMRGYKITRIDGTSFADPKIKFEVGKTYKIDADQVELCKTGFHYCPIPVYCYNYNKHMSDEHYKYFEVEHIGSILVCDRIKCASNMIRVVREIPIEEWDRLINCDIQTRRFTFTYRDGKLVR